MAVSIEQVSAVISAVGTAGTAVLGIYLRGKIKAVQVNVDGRLNETFAKLTDALADNVRLKDAAGEPPGPPAAPPAAHAAVPGRRTRRR